MSTLDETADRIAIRFVVRTELGQMRNPFYWLFRVTKRFGVHEGEPMALVMARVEFYIAALLAREAEATAAMQPSPNRAARRRQAAMSRTLH